MQGCLSHLQTTHPAFPASVSPSSLSSPPELPLHASAQSAFTHSAFVSSLPAQRPWLDPHAHMPQDLSTVPTMHFAHGQPWPASLSLGTSPAHARVTPSRGPVSSPISGTSFVDAALPHNNGLFGRYASPYQQQPQSSSFAPAEWSYPAAACSGEETACDVTEDLAFQQQTPDCFFGGYAAQPSPDTTYLARGTEDRNLAQPDATADLSGTSDNEALSTDLITELGYLLPADNIESGSDAAAESGAACIFAGLQHAVILTFLRTDLRALLVVIYHIVCIICRARFYELAVPEICLLCFAICHLSQPNMLLFFSPYHQQGLCAHCSLDCTKLNLQLFSIIFCCPQGVAMASWVYLGASMSIPFSTTL